MKLWNKNSKLNRAIENFTIGNDHQLDLLLAPHDILGSMAHVIMLKETGFLTETETKALYHELKDLYYKAEKGELKIEEGVEDIHSQVEKILTDRLGDTAGKVHTARSRNDQVLLDLKLFSRQQLTFIFEKVQILFNKLIALSEEHKEVLMPGYTHLQAAMPSSFGLFFGAFAESLTDDMIILSSAYRLINQNPLGSAAGYGSSFAINRKRTTELLGFDTLVYNSIYSQMGRGKTEKVIAFALSSIASSLSKLAMDMTLFMSQNFNFISLAEEFTTGSSIMPHKKNPDVLELIRARCNRLQSLPNEISAISTNLPMGYHRDYQEVKEAYLPAFPKLLSCLNMMILVLENITLNENILEDERYKYIFSVEEINKKVQGGIPFREAYHKVAGSISNGEFHPDKNIEHKHSGSIGNLCTKEIIWKMDKIVLEFNFNTTQEALSALLNSSQS